MILAGIDEAGYGPVLGPLVVGCCAFEIPGGDDVLAPLPCLWKALRKCVSKSKSKTGRKLHVNDSKQVYSPSTGVKDLERSVLALAQCAWNDWDGSQEQLIALLAPSLSNDLPQYSWYAEAGAFPLAQEAITIKLIANALKIEMKRTEIRCVHLHGRVVLERELNRIIDATRNKGAMLFSISAIHIDHLLRNFGERGLIIFCDRQGGREHYGSLLRTMFEEWSLQIVDEKPHRAEYRLQKGGAMVRIIFCEKAEAQCMSVAYASMISKYLREALMRRFNAFWKNYLPDVEPTAGYYNDGLRFLRDIDGKRRELGIDESQLVRCR